MANTPDLVSCVAGEDGGRELLPLNPFYALRYHFGMLLGVDDFETEQAYHRAKMWLHNSWLHREGVIWGFGVKVDETTGEIRVAPGLALDAAGHELHLEAEACLNVGEWFDKHKDEVGGQTFDAHVVIRFKACLTRQVPALMEPCNNAGTSTAYSRVFETLEILLLPNLAPPPVFPFHRLRLLFGLDGPRKQKDKPAENTPADQEVLDEITKIQALPSSDQTAAWLQAFHRFAALDEIEMQPATSEDGATTLLFPGRENDPVVLANITGLKLTKKNNVWKLSGGTVDTSVRPSHVATTTIQDLLCGLPGGVSSASSALGPRIDRSQVSISNDGSTIALPLDQPLNKFSVKVDAFAVSIFDPAAGWTTPAPVIVDPPVLSDADKKITLKLTTPLGKGWVRIIARGSGTTPLMGANNRPLAGAAGDPPAPQGADFVTMKERT